MTEVAEVSTQWVIVAAYLYTLITAIRIITTASSRQLRVVGVALASIAVAWIVFYLHISVSEAFFHTFDVPVARWLSRGAQAVTIGGLITVGIIARDYTQRTSIGDLTIDELRELLNV